MSIHVEKMLVVVDMQTDLIKYSSAPAKEIVPKVAQKIKDFMNDKSYHTIMWTKTYFLPGSGLNLEFHPDIQLLYDVYTHIHGVSNLTTLHKEWAGYEYWDSFVTGRFEDPYYPNDDLVFDQVKEIHLVGIFTDTCILNNAILLRTYFPRTQIYVHTSCCVGNTKEKHDNAIAAMRPCNIIICD